ncbi:MAG TPA: protein kinase [Kofleriaceae bacterium]|nr:protein kinase [Kofleriaceae bacterium]
MGLPGNEDRPTVPASGPASTSGSETPDEIPRISDHPELHDARVARFPTHFRGPRRYEILGEHGRGGIGRVSRAFDRKLGRDVAIKELHARTSANEVRFLREVLITARLEHPGIVPVHEAGRWPDGTPYYAMKLVSGRPLRALIAERANFEQRIGLLHHVIAVADAIAYAHGRNIIHRDLKPANVIVGEFGETIVIDWGLAKDLTTPDYSPNEADEFAASQDGDVTLEGCVLGTPAYMAPEQKRGEAVDQRADVYAIGTMLWELCAVQKAPPAKAHLRSRMLGRAGVDRDLAAIINKALDPDREQRYPDAGALAADLKAFKSGARIAARDYTLFAMLAHWTRRHRTLALSVLAALVLALAGSLLYVRNIAIERDRADSSLDELTLKHAQLLLTTDPSAAVDVLLGYRGTDLGRADQIRAEAIGRGVAVLRTLPHTDVVSWTGTSPDGAIISLSTDGTIARTYLDGTSSVLTRGVSKIAIAVYARTRHLLAYTCDPADLCLFDLATGTRTALATTLQGASVNGASFSADGTLLAVLSKDGTLRILDVADASRPTIQSVHTVPGSQDVVFIDDSALALAVEGGVQFLRVTGDSERFDLAGLALWTPNAGEHEIVLATRTGAAMVVETFPARVAQRADLCPGTITNLKSIPGRRSIAYACREGTIGVWDLQQGAVRRRAQLEGHADFVLTSPGGDYIVAAGGNGTVTVIDLVTDLIASYKGHGVRLTSLSPPSPDHPFVISGDARGGVRVWPVPPRFARVVATSSAPFLTAIFDKASTAVTATTPQPALTVYSPTTGVRTLQPHERLNVTLERSASGKTFATYGFQDLVEVWSAATMTRARVIATAHGSISQLRFVGDTEEFITAGHDGRLVRWLADGEQRLIAQANQPVDNLAPITTTGAVVFSTVDGALWWTDGASPPRKLREPGSRVNRLLVTPDQQRVYAGYASGELLALDTASWQLETVLRGHGAIREIRITSDRRSIAVVFNDGVIHLGMYRNPGAASPTWTILLAGAHDIALTADGLLVASCPNGTLWLYSPPRRRWLCLPTGTADLGKLALAADDKAAVALDREGRLIWIDLEAARKLLDVTRYNPERRQGA